MADRAVTAVARGVADLATKEASFLCGVHDEVEFLREDLTTLQTFLSVAAEAKRSGSGGDAVAADSVRRIRNVAYEAENIIDTADYRAKRNSRRTGLLGAMSRYARKPRDLVVLHRLGKDILRVRRRIQEIKSSREVLDAIDADGRVIARAQEPIAPRARLVRPAATGDEPFVGFEVDVEQIVARLNDSGNTQLSVVSIVAMGGAGKTTLASKVYNSVAVKEHFDAFAFVSISQQFEAHTVLKEITAQAMGIKRRDKESDRGQADELEKLEEEELAEMLHSFLERKRYLIVLDDVWRMDTWEAIQHAFPDQGNGSRVMLTTRNLQVAKQADKLTHIHEVRLLNEQESWGLFSLKAFPSYENFDARNRQELETVGKNLAKKCHGLPLALVVLGSHLSRNLHLDTWSRMERCLHWEVTSNWNNMQQIIGRSYDNMSSPLKSCFLAIASIPEDFIIPAQDLIKRWIAESFVPHRPNQTLEDSAYDCLVELVQRSMVHVVEWDDTQGRISLVRMHDILREWAIEKAREDGFLKVCKSRDDVADRMSVYLLSFQDFFDNQVFTFVPNVRSMSGFNLPSVTLDSPRFLRAVFMYKTNLEKVSEVLDRLVHLRYIGLIGCKNVVLPSSIGRLLNLQSIDLSGTQIPRVPKFLWDIPTLRHVLISVEGSFNLAAIRVAEQNNLQTMIIHSTMVSTAKLGTGSTRWIRLKRYIMRMTQLRILTLSVSNSVRSGRNSARYSGSGV